jgi:hypothetical protein
MNYGPLMPSVCMIALCPEAPLTTIQKKREQTKRKEEGGKIRR